MLTLSNLFVNKVFLVSYPDPNIKIFLEKAGGIVSFNLDSTDKFDAVVFPPGDDISPFLYGEVKYKRTTCNLVRDMTENRLYRKIPNNVPKIGIGRGAQFLNIMNGGSLWQNVSGHLVNHDVINFSDGETYFVSSKHHQEMIPAKHGLNTLGAAVADVKETPHKLIRYDVALDKAKNNYRDVEGVYYEDTASYCFQPRVYGTPLHKAELNSNELFFEHMENYLKDQFYLTFRLAS